MIDTERDDSRAPWTPPGLRLPRVGDRVRINTAGGECQCKGEPHSRMADAGREGHYPGEHGLRGAVVSVDPPESWLAIQGHPYEVLYDGGARDFGEDGWGAFGSYAAIELELLADDDGG